MSIQINRFEAKQIEGMATQNIKINNRTTILIKDHTTDKIVSFIQLENDLDKNKEIADLLIAAIESYIEDDNE